MKLVIFPHSPGLGDYSPDSQIQKEQRVTSGQKNLPLTE